jgi:Tfp pilus assembly protein PilF
LPELGDRAAAEKAMQQAAIAFKAGKTNEASLAYEKAIDFDPSYFDAHYNSALLAFQAGDVARALMGWEMALTIETKSANARYNFALALKQGGYPHDAANELEKIIEDDPTDTRAHLSLANLYAQQLNERGKARNHYVKVLEFEPRNPQAPAIRFWLAANP